MTRFTHLALAAALSASLPAPALAQSVGSQDELPAYLQCVPYAREVSGITIYGDAYTWWDQAEGRYARGHTPQVGAVMAFAPYQGMQLGHVAAVSRILDSRTVLLDHANWSPIDGRRGQIERGVRAVDVSPANDWSEVRVWYAPINGLGTTAWPVRGFIYRDPAAKRRSQDRPLDVGATQIAVASPAVRGAPSGDFLQAFGTLGQASRQSPSGGKATRVASAPRTPGGLAVLSANYAPKRNSAAPSNNGAAPARDRYATVIARYE